MVREEDMIGAAISFTLKKRVRILGQGVPLPVVSARLGHADPNITLSVYSHALPADVRAASKAWHKALADVISDDRKNRTAQNLGKSRKLAVNQ
jgi:hypothetical protein